MSRNSFRAPVFSRLRTSAASFARTEDGSATIWNVTWLLVFAGMAGLSIDSSNGYRNIAISQSTSDASSLAGVIQLPNPLDEVPYDPNDTETRDQVAITNAKAEAVDYSKKNMALGTYGRVLTEDEVIVGNWDPEVDRTAQDPFTPVGSNAFGNKTMNAVRVYLQQNEGLRGNGVNTMLMHMVGMSHWSVATTATAMAGYPTCLGTAIMTKRKYCNTSNNTYSGDLCFWADEGFKLGNGNTWGGSVAMTPRCANNDGVRASNHQSDGFRLDENMPPYEVQFVDDIATFDDSDTGITHDILTGDSRFAQKTGGFDANNDPIREAPSGSVIRLETSSIGSEGSSSWLDLEPSVQVADLGGFSSIGALLGVSQGRSSSSSSSGGGSSSGGAGNGNMCPNIPPGCPEGRSVGSEIDPIADYNLNVFGSKYHPDDARYGGDTDNANVVQFAVDQNGNPVTETDGDLAPNRIYYHDSSDTLEISGTLDSVVVVTRGQIVLKNGALLKDVTLVSLDDRANGSDGISVNGGDTVTIGAPDDSGLCDEAGGVKMYAMSSITGSANTAWNGVLAVSGGSFGFAANSDATHGISIHAAGNIHHAAHNAISSCGVPIQFDRDNLRYSIVE